MTAVMYDATNPSSIPASVPAPDYAAGYIDGQWPSYTAMHNRYPSAIPASITVQGSLGAQIADVENGDLSPRGGALWAYDKLWTGVVPCLYCSESSWPAVRAACIAADVIPSAVDWWIAGYPGSVGWALYPGSIGHQVNDYGSYDYSIILDGWIPGRPVSSAPPPPVIEPPFGETTMQAVPFSTTLDVSGHTDLAIPLPAGCSKVIAVSLDLRSVYGANPPAWDPAENVIAEPAVGNPNLPAAYGEVYLKGAPGHYYTGHAIVA